MTSGDRFHSKVTVVTGAAQGIGRRVAERLMEEGGMVVAVDRSPLVNDVVASNSAGFAVVADLEHYGDCEQMIDAAVGKFGHIDILINNVGGTIWAKPFEYYEPDQIQAEISRSLFPTLWCCRAALPVFLRQERGVIVNVSSVSTRGVNRVPYGAAKGGINALTACLALENGTRGIRVNAVAPGATEAPPRSIPRHTHVRSEQEERWYAQIYEQSLESSLMRRMGSLDEQAAAILFLASDDASYITGVTLPVAGGDLG